MDEKFAPQKKPPTKNKRARLKKKKKNKRTTKEIGTGDAVGCGSRRKMRGLSVPLKKKKGRT